MRTRITQGIGVSLVALALTAGFPAAASAQEPSPEPVLTVSEIQARAEVLADRYTEVGQMLSPEDAKFVMTYLADDTPSKESAPQSRLLTSGTPVKVTGTGGGQQGWLGGSMDTKLSGAFSLDNSYTVSLAASGTKGITKTKVCAHVVSYGVAGQGGVGVVYTDNPCGSSSSSSYWLKASKRFSAYAVATTITSDATFYYNGGSFQIHS